MLLLGAVAAPSAQAGTFSTLHGFKGSPDGQNSFSGLIQDASGNLYGTTLYGGTSFAGVVFEVSASGTETVLYNFTGTTDGADPLDPLLIDSSGNLYGTTYSGGASNFGVVFKVDSSGTESVLYSFEGGTSDGCYPAGGLIADSSGNLYGMTSSCGASNYGTVFKLTPSGQETTLHSFAGGATDGASPYYGRLLMETGGNLVGLTSYGGADNLGALFQLTPAGKLTVLHSFAGGTADGCYPYGSVAMDKAGNFYGTTEECGKSDFGIVWKVSAKGAETILHSFAGTKTDGSYPYAGVVMDTSGNLYGDAAAGGANFSGVLYELSKTGKLTLLHSFSNTTDSTPFGSILRNAKGVIYGTTEGNGEAGYGSVWSFK
jgi:uncharacterized repeat protein (TIGR03803 family)